MNKKHLIFIFLYAIIGLVFLRNISLINYNEIHYVFVILFFAAVILSIFLHLKFYRSALSARAEKWFLSLTTSVFSLLLISGAVLLMFPPISAANLGGTLVAMFICSISVGLWIISLVIGLVAIGFNVVIFQKRHLVFIFLYAIIGLVFLIDAFSKNITLINYNEIHYMFVVLFCAAIILSIYLHLKFYRSALSARAEKWFLSLTASVFSLLLISGAVLLMFPPSGWFDFGGALVVMFILFTSFCLWIATLVIGLVAIGFNVGHFD